MEPNRYSVEVREAIARLQHGGRLFFVEEKPYPAPHKIVIVLEDERYSVSYNDFAFLVSRQVIQSIGSTVFDTFPAEEYGILPE
jgi:hypothetical protein